MRKVQKRVLRVATMRTLVRVKGTEKKLSFRNGREK